MASRAMLEFAIEEGASEPRYSVWLAATIATTTGEVPVRICEIWLGGAIVEGQKLPGVGKDVFLGRNGMQAFGAIVSAGQDRCEVEFEDRIDEGQLLLWLYSPGEKVQPVFQPRFERTSARDARPSATPSWEQFAGKTFSRN